VCKTRVLEPTVNDSTKPESVLLAASDRDDHEPFEKGNPNVKRLEKPETRLVDKMLVSRDEGNYHRPGIGRSARISWWLTSSRRFA